MFHFKKASLFSIPGQGNLCRWKLDLPSGKLDLPSNSGGAGSSLEESGSDEKINLGERAMMTVGAGNPQTTPNHP